MTEIFTTLIDFQVRTFSPIIKKFNLSPLEQVLLKVLASENPLPLEVLALILEKTEQELFPSLKNLIDLNLVVTIDINFGISAPVRESVYKLQGHLSDREYKSIGERLLSKYWTNTTEIPSLAIVDLTIHAFAHSNIQKLCNFGDIVIPSQLLRVAKEAYDSKNWDNAIEFAKRALELDAERNLARVILFKAYVRKEYWDLARKELETIRVKGIKGYFYCRGFFEWKSGRLSGAISAFKSAISAGDTSISVYRDLAHCLYRLGRIDDATEILNTAPQWIFRNSYVVDLAAQIAIAKKEFSKGKSYIDTLEHIANPDIFYLRRSMYYVALGKLTEALEDAESACSGDNPTFQALSQKADVLIEQGKFPTAKNIIDELRPPNSMKHDVKTGLKCKLLLRQNLWSEAEIQFERLHNKELPVARFIRKEILEQKMVDTRITKDERENAIAELKNIGKLLNIPLIIDDEDVSQ